MAMAISMSAYTSIYAHQPKDQELKGYIKVLPPAKVTRQSSQQGARQTEQLKSMDVIEQQSTLKPIDYGQLVVQQYNRHSSQYTTDNKTIVLNHSLLI